MVVVKITTITAITLIPIPNKQAAVTLTAIQLGMIIAVTTMRMEKAANLSTMAIDRRLSCELSQCSCQPTASSSSSL